MGLCLFSTLSAQAADNLITNPGFESLLTGWTKSGSFNAVKNAQGGIYSARGGTAQGTLTQNVMSKLQVGGKYTLSMYAKLDSMGVSSMVAMRFKNSRGGILQENRMIVGSTAWKAYSTTFTVPANSTVAEVYAIKESGASSYMYIDTLSLTGLDVVSDPPVNAAPALIGAQVVNATEDSALSFNVMPATDSNGDAITYTKLTNPSVGTLVCDGGASRTCLFTPPADFYGAVSFTYKANDGLVDSNTSTVTINVAAVNDLPVLPGSQSVTTANSTPVNFNLNAADDIDSSNLTYIKVSNPSTGTVNCTGGASTACTYTPVTGYAGTTSFTYKAYDGLGDSNTAVVSITIAPAANRAPVIVNSSMNVATAYGAPVNFNLISAADADGDLLTYAKVTDPTSGTANCTGTACTYTPVAGFSGATSFTYKANDGKADSNTAVVNITVADAINNAPAIGNTSQTVSTAFNTAVNFTLGAATDVDGDTLTYSKVTNPSSGTANCAGTTCTYTPAAGFSGSTSFTYKANDGKLDSNTATVTVTVAAPVVTAPILSYTPRGVGGGGAMSGVSISPYANLWFVGTDMGTLFKSTDLGQSWNAVNHNQAVFDSDLTKAVSVGFSADGTTVFHAAAGVSPKRSLNSGDTFSAISMGLTAGELIKYWYSDSSNANIIYAGTTKGLLRTVNKGTSWTRVNSEEAVGTFIDHNTAGKVYHATKTKVYTSSDDGASFSTIFYTGAVRLFAGGSDATGVTLAISDVDGRNACAWSSPYLADWGQTSIDQTTAACGYVWTSKNGEAFTKTTKDVGDHLKMADNDSSTIYTTGARAWIRQYGTKVHVSKDKGTTWSLKLNQIDYDVIPYAPWPSAKIEWSAVALDIGWWDSGYESFAINQNNSAVVAGSGYFFMHSSLNAGENWKAAFSEYADTGTITAGKKWKTRGLEVISVYRMKYHPTNKNLLYGASADIGGVVSEDAGVSYRIPKAGYNSWYDFAFDPANDQVAYGASGSLHDFPNEWHANAVTGNGGIYRSTNRGRSWTRLTPVDTNFNRQFLSVGYDARNRIIYGGTQEVGIAVSSNDGASWTYYNAGLPAGNKIIPQIEVDPNTGNVYALLTGDAPTFSNQAYTGVYFLDVANGATSWRLLRGVVNYPAEAMAGSKVWYYPTAFAIDFNNPETIWLVDYENHGNWLMTGAWKTTNNGATWNRMKQVTHAVDIKIDPTNNDQVHVASYYQLDGQWGNGGMLFTRDAGASWEKNTTPPLQRNARSVTFDENDPGKIFYSYFGGGILWGANPAR